MYIYIYIHTYVYIHIHTHIYIYIYIERERVGATQLDPTSSVTRSMASPNHHSKRESPKRGYLLGCSLKVLGAA